MWRPAEPVERNGLWYSMVVCSGVTDTEPSLATEVFSSTGQVHATREQAEEAAEAMAEAWNERDNADD